MDCKRAVRTAHSPAIGGLSTGGGRHETKNVRIGVARQRRGENGDPLRAPSSISKARHMSSCDNNGEFKLSPGRTFR